MPGASCRRRTRPSPPPEGNAWRKTPCTTLKIAALAPMPRASVATAAAAKTGLRFRPRTPYRTSCRRVSITGAPVASRDASLCFSIPPNASSASRRASSGGRPRSTNLRVSMSMGKRISSSSWLSTAGRRKRARKTVLTRKVMAAPLLACSARGQNARDRLREPLPAFLLLGELLSAAAGQLVEAGAPVVLRGAPLRADPPLRFQAVERRVQRPLVDLEDILGELLDPLGDPPSVHRRCPQRLQDENVESPLEEVGSGRHRVSFRPSTGVSLHLLSNVKGRGSVSCPLVIRQECTEAPVEG